jgi:hypothetical protein
MGHVHERYPYSLIVSNWSLRRVFFCSQQIFKELFMQRKKSSRRVSMLWLLAKLRNSLCEEEVSAKGVFWCPPCGGLIIVKEPFMRKKA